MTRRFGPVAVVVAVLVLAAVGLWQAGRDRPLGLEERTTAIAAELRCPTCQAQSVAMSHSDIAQAMQAEIRAQLVAGRSPEQVEAWFVARYGPDVLLDPPSTGVGLWLWLVPGALLVGGLIAAVAVVRRRRPGTDPPEARARGRVVAGRIALPLAALAVAGAGVVAWSAVDGAGPAEASAPAAAPEDAEGWLARGTAFEAEGDLAAAVDAYRRAVELRPDDARPRVRLGLALLKSGEPVQAGAVARQLLAAHPEQPEGLLVLGLAERARALPEARGTLQRFLDLAPDHPAAGEVRRLIPGP